MVYPQIKSNAFCVSELGNTMARDSSVRLCQVKKAFRSEGHNVTANAMDMMEGLRQHYAA